MSNKLNRDRIDSIDTESLHRVENMASTMAKASNGIITERQAIAAILFKGSNDTNGSVSFIENNLTGQDVAKLMDIDKSTVYSLSSTAMDKLAGAKFLMHIVEEEPWWAIDIEDN